MATSDTTGAGENPGCDTASRSLPAVAIKRPRRHRRWRRHPRLPRRRERPRGHRDPRVHASSMGRRASTGVGSCPDCPTGVAHLSSIAELRGEHPQVCDRRHRQRQTPLPGTVRRRRPHRDGGTEEHQLAGLRERARAGTVTQDWIVDGAGPRGEVAGPGIADRLEVVAQLLVEERGSDEVARVPGPWGVPGHGALLAVGMDVASDSRMPQRDHPRAAGGPGVTQDTKGPSLASAGEGPGAPGSVLAQDIGDRCLKT